MADNPSFSEMYRRGRFSPLETSEQGQDVIKNKREEDFAVAAVAFVLKHDEIFKRHFLENVCGIKLDKNLDSYQILLHPYDFDLVVTNQSKSEVVVFEFKVDAKLEPHQKYFGDGTFSKSPKGYGCQIKEKYPATCSPQKYIILQKREKFKEEQRNEKVDGVVVSAVQCYSRSWLDLFPETSTLANDLQDSLAFSFDINELKSRYFMKKNLAGSAKEAAEIYELLKTIAKDFGEEFSKPTGTIGKNGFECFGIELRRSSVGAGDFAFLKEHQDPDRFIWFGYEPNAGGGNAIRISIWICALKEEEKRNQVKEKIKKEISGYDIDETTDATGLIVYNDGNRIGDLEWFNEVLNFLKNLK